VAPAQEAAVERLMSTLLLESRSIPPHRLVDLLARRTRQFLGASGVAVYLIDLGQETLAPLPAPRDPAARHAEEPMGLEETQAGAAYRTGQAVSHEEDGHVRLWMPLIDGSERLGVMGMTFAALDDPLRKRVEELAALFSEILVSKNRYGDLMHRTRRRDHTSVAAELQWSLLPPLTATVRGTVVSGILEPAYDIGGDSFDYAFNDDVAHLGLFDAMGHGLSAATTASVAVAAYRHARRQERDLEETYHLMDAAVREEFPEHFVTAQIAQLHTTDGRLRWLNAGHPAPFHVRDGRVLGDLASPPTLPIGLSDPSTTVAEAELEPGDRLFFFTDGVVEARSAIGRFFGQDRLMTFLERESASTGSAPEILRRLSHEIIAYQDGSVQDDATTLFLEWNPD
jgi:serine phosphatase RsbU (regulator of sigma subunit)